MIGLRLVCAWDAVEIARAIARPLSAEGFLVSIATGQTGLQELENPARGAERLIVLWSLDSASSPYVWRWIDEAGEDGLIEIETANGVAPARAERKLAPIDFSEWRGDRGSAAWKALDERVKLAVFGKAAGANLRMPALVFGLMALTAIGGAAVMRAFDSGTQEAEATAPAAGPDRVIEDEAAMGGPIAISADLDDGPFVSAVHITHLQPLPEVPAVQDLLEMNAAPREAPRNQSLLGRIGARLQGR